MGNYEEKYKQALDDLMKIKNANKDNKELVDFIEHKYPELELKEDEDDKIRKDIINYLKGFIPHHDDELVAKSRVWIAWLEKQYVHKPTWSEEDENILNDCIKLVTKSSKSSAQEQGIIDWLKSIKNKLIQL